MSSIFKKPLGGTTKAKPKPKPKSKPADTQMTLPPPTYATRPPKGQIPVPEEEKEDEQTSVAQLNRPTRKLDLRPLDDDEEDEREEEREEDTSFGLLPPERGQPVYQNPFDEVPPRSHGISRGRRGRYEDEHDGDTHDRSLLAPRNSRPHHDPVLVRDRLPSHASGSIREGTRRGYQPRDPYGQAPYGQAPYGQVPYGQIPYGQAPYGQSPYGQAPHDQMNENLNERRLARMSLNPSHRGQPEPSSNTALIRAVAAAPTSAVTVFRNPNSPASDIIALPKFAQVSEDTLSASHVSAIMSIFGVTRQKVSDWCAIGYIERDNRTQALNMDRIFELFDSTFRARWEARMQEDKMGITAQREREDQQRKDHERFIFEQQLQRQADDSAARDRAHRAELEGVKEMARARSKERKKADEKRKEKERQKSRERKREWQKERDRTKERERLRDRELKMAFELAKKNKPAPAAPAPAPIIINNTQPERRRSRSREKVVVHGGYGYGYGWGRCYHPWYW